MIRLGLRGVSVRDDAGRTGLQAIDLDLIAGRCIALLGDRAAGGSLLLDAVAGHVPVAQGSLEADGVEIGRLPPAARGIGMVSPRDPLFWHLDVAGNVAFPLRAAGIKAAERTARLADALALLGLEAQAGLRPRALDEATRVRTGLARALTHSQRLLLLDDPFGGLDPAPRQLLQRTLRRLVRARGLTVLLTTADRDEALLLGDEIGILEQGRLHQVGPAATLLDRPADPVVAQRIADANVLTGQVVALEDGVATVRLACGHAMEAEADEALETGSLCLLCVRPDRIATAFIRRPGLEPTTDSLPATLLESIHLGDHLRLRFRLEDGSELLVRRPAAAVVGALRPDHPALLAWQPHQARAFPGPA